jgi:hypothetical protein
MRWVFTAFFCSVFLFSCSKEKAEREELCMQEIERVKINHYSLSDTEEIVLEEYVGLGRESIRGGSKSFDITLSERFPSSWTRIAPVDTVLEITSMVEGTTTGNVREVSVGAERKYDFSLRNVPLLNSLDPGTCCDAVGCDTTCAQSCGAIFSFQMKIPKERFDVSEFLEVDYSVQELSKTNEGKTIRVNCAFRNKKLTHSYITFLVPNMLAGFTIRTLSHSDGLREQRGRAYNMYIRESPDDVEEIHIDIRLEEVDRQAVGQLYFDKFVVISGKIGDALLFRPMAVDFQGTVTRSEKSELVYTGDVIVDI